MLVAIQMDPIENIDINTDSTFSLMVEALKRNYKIYVYNVNDLSLKKNKVIASVKEVLKLQNKQGNHVKLSLSKTVSLSMFDVILMRQDPPFNLSYITATHLLEKLMPKTLVINNPKSVRDSPEKIMVTRFNKLVPNTLITRNTYEISKFRKEYKQIIIKPLYGNGGSDVFYIKNKDPNFSVILEKMFSSFLEPLIVQEYLPKVTKGDKRILLVNGKPVGAINRIPRNNEIRSNLHIGGLAKKSTLTKNDIYICEEIGPYLKEKGLLFAGIDIIDNKLTEINVTSPTCIQEIDKYNNSNISSLIWDEIKKML